jgi:hypothetical protein
MKTRVLWPTVFALACPFVMAAPTPAMGSVEFSLKARRTTAVRAAPAHAPLRHPDSLIAPSGDPRAGVPFGDGGSDRPRTHGEAGGDARALAGAAGAFGMMLFVAGRRRNRI